MWPSDLNSGAMKFGIEAPVFIADLSPRVSDVMERNVISVRRDSSAYDAIQTIERERLRGLPVIDEENRCLGLLSAFRVCQRLFPARDGAGESRLIEASLPSMVETFGGNILAGTMDCAVRKYLLVVAAMRAESFSARLGAFDPAQTSSSATGFPIPRACRSRDAGPTARCPPSSAAAALSTASAVSASFAATGWGRGFRTVIIFNLKLKWRCWPVRNPPASSW